MCCQADYNSHFVSVSVYQGGSRVCCPNSVLEQGVFSNGECALVKLRNDAANSNSDFTLVVSQHGAKREFNYTLQVYTQREATTKHLQPNAGLALSSRFDGLAQVSSRLQDASCPARSS